MVMVGGSTRVPLVRQMVGEYFGSDPLCHLDPDQVVALGAAIQADLLTGSSGLADLLLLEPLSLGIETMGGVVERLILRCSPIQPQPPGPSPPTWTVRRWICTCSRESESWRVTVAPWAASSSADPAHARRSPPREGEFTVDANGMLTVSAVEQYTETRAEIEVSPPTDWRRTTSSRCWRTPSTLRSRTWTTAC